MGVVCYAFAFSRMEGEDEVKQGAILEADFALGIFFCFGIQRRSFQKEER